MKGNRRLAALFVACVTLFCGCTLSFDLARVDRDAAPRIPLRARLVLTPDFCDYTYSLGWATYAHLGTALCGSSRQLFEQAFSEVVVANAATKDPSFDADLTIKPSVAGVSASFESLPIRGEAEIVVGWTITDRYGQLLAFKNIGGKGAIRGWFGTDLMIYERSLQAALDDLFANVAAYLMTAAEKGELVSKSASP